MAGEHAGRARGRRAGRPRARPRRRSAIQPAEERGGGGAHGVAPSGPRKWRTGGARCPVSGSLTLDAPLSVAGGCASAPPPARPGHLARPVAQDRTHGRPPSSDASRACAPPGSPPAVGRGVGDGDPQSRDPACGARVPRLQCGRDGCLDGDPRLRLRGDRPASVGVVAVAQLLPSALRRRCWQASGTDSRGRWRCWDGSWSRGWRCSRWPSGSASARHRCRVRPLRHRDDHADPDPAHPVLAAARARRHAGRADRGQRAVQHGRRASGASSDRSRSGRSSRSLIPGLRSWSPAWRCSPGRP